MFKVINGLIYALGNIRYILIEFWTEPRAYKGSRKGIEILPCLNSFHLLIKVHCVTWI